MRESPELASIKETKKVSFTCGKLNKKKLKEVLKA